MTEEVLGRLQHSEAQELEKERYRQRQGCRVETMLKDAESVSGSSVGTDVGTPEVC